MSRSLFCKFELAFVSGRFVLDAVAEPSQRIEAAALLFRAMDDIRQKPGSFCRAFSVTEDELASALRGTSPQPKDIEWALPPVGGIQ